MTNLYKSLISSQKSFGKIVKDNTATVLTKSGSTYNYQYADLGSVIDEIKTHLHDNGLVYSQPLEVLDGEQILSTILIHAESGEKLVSNAKIVCKDPTDPQQMGSAITYMRRYALLSLLGLSPEQDDDGSIASGRPKSEAMDTPRTAPKTAPQSTDEMEVGPDQYYNSYEKKVYNPEPCSVCGKEVKASSVSYSNYKYGQTLCYDHQKQYDAEGR